MKKVSDNQKDWGDGMPEPVELPVEVQERLGAQLKETYANVVSEPLPERFTLLLDELIRKSAKLGDGQ